MLLIPYLSDLKDLDISRLAVVDLNTSIDRAPTVALPRSAIRQPRTMRWMAEAIMAGYAYNIADFDISASDQRTALVCADLISAALLCTARLCST